MDKHRAPHQAVVVHVRDHDAHQAKLVVRRLASHGFAIDIVLRCH